MRFDLGSETIRSTDGFECGTLEANLSQYKWGVDHMPTRETVLQAALLLSPDDRALLVEDLVESLDRGEFATPEIAAAWSAEIDRRIAAYDRGEIKTLAAEQSLDHLRRSLAEYRAGLTLDAIREGLADVKAGRTKPARETLLDLAGRYKIILPTE